MIDTEDMKVPNAFSMRFEKTIKARKDEHTRLKNKARKERKFHRSHREVRK